MTILITISTIFILSLLTSYQNSLKTNAEPLNGDQITKSGGWILEISGEMYHGLKIAKHHVAPDEGLGRLLCELYKGYDMYDLGAGVGQYGKYIEVSRCDISWVGFDGAKNVEEFTNSYVKHLDLTFPLNMPKKRLVMSLEVGEHIPVDYEQSYIDNIVSATSESIILSWAIEGQPGHYHVNCRNNDYIIFEMTRRGFEYNELQSLMFRKQSRLPWFKNTIMVFKRIQREWMIQIYSPANFKEHVVGKHPNIQLVDVLCGGGTRNCMNLDFSSVCEIASLTHPTINFTTFITWIRPNIFIDVCNLGLYMDNLQRRMGRFSIPMKLGYNGKQCERKLDESILIANNYWVNKCNMKSSVFGEDEAILFNLEEKYLNKRSITLKNSDFIIGIQSNDVNECQLN